MRWLWVVLGLLSVGVGMLGVFLPLIPTVPLMLLAAFFFARSSERLHAWLLNHPVFGPGIEDWQRSGAIGQSAKIWATVSIGIAFLIPLWIGLRPVILIIQAVVLGAVLIFIWTRPSA